MNKERRNLTGEGKYLQHTYKCSSRYGLIHRQYIPITLLISHFTLHDANFLLHTDLLVGPYHLFDILYVNLPGLHALALGRALHPSYLH